MYDQLIECLKNKGISAFFQKRDQLVISAAFPHSPTHNSFWITRSADIWYLSTWLPVIYKVSPTQNICIVCATVLESSKTAIYRVNEECIKKFALEEISAETADLLLTSIFGQNDE